MPGVTLGQVEAAVRGENASIPGGAVDVGLRKFNIKTSGSYETLDEIEQTVVASHGGRLVMLRDVAEVSWDTAEESYTGRYNGRRAVFVTANAKDRVDVFAVRDAIYEQVAAFERELPEGVTLERGFDQTRNVQHRLSRLGIDFAIAIGAGAAHAAATGSACVDRRDDLDPAVARDRARDAARHAASRSTSCRSPASCWRSACSWTTRSSWWRTSRASCAPATRASRPRSPPREQIALAVIGCTATLMFAFLPLLFLPGAPGIVHPLAARRRALHGARVAAGLAHRDPVPVQPAARRTRTRACTATARSGRSMTAIHRIYAPALHRRARASAAHAARRAGLTLACARARAADRAPRVPEAGIPQFRIAIEAPDGAQHRRHRPRAAVRGGGTRAPPGGEARLRERRAGQPAGVLQHFPARRRTPNVADAVRASSSSTTPSGTPQLLEDAARKPSRRTRARSDLVDAFENGPPIEAPIAMRRAGAGPGRSCASSPRRVEREIEATPGTRDVDNPLQRQRTDLRARTWTRARRRCWASPPVEIDRTVRAAVAGLDVGKFREPDGDEYRLSRSACRCRAARRCAALDAIEVASASGRQVPLRAAGLHRSSRRAPTADPPPRPPARGDRYGLHALRLQHRQGDAGRVAAPGARVVAGGLHATASAARHSQAEESLRRHRQRGARRDVRHPRRAGAGVRQLPLDAHRRGRDTARCRRAA